MTVRYDGMALPCCYHRVGEQYRAGGDDRPVGNVFTDGVRSVWDSAEYRSLRTAVHDPVRLRNGDSPPQFCDGCDHVQIPPPGHRIVGSTTRWEQVYFHDSQGTVRRRSSPLG